MHLFLETLLIGFSVSNNNVLPCRRLISSKSKKIVYKSTIYCCLNHEESHTEYHLNSNTRFDPDISKTMEVVRI